MASSNGLMLILSKTEALITGTRSQVAKFDSTAGIRIGDTTVNITTLSYKISVLVTTTSVVCVTFII